MRTTTRQQTIRAMERTNAMTTHLSMIYTLGGIIWVSFGAMILFLQETFHKTQINIPENYLIFFALIFAIFGGSLSYSIFIKDRKEKFNTHDYLNNVGKSVFVVLFLGFLLADYLSANAWFASILGGAFFKDLVIIFIPKIFTKKADKIFDLDESKDPAKEIDKVEK